MGIDFSRFTKDIQDKIKAALTDIKSPGKIDAAEVRAMKLDKKVAIELMKQLSGFPEYVGDGYFVTKKNNYSILSIDEITNDTIIPLNEKAIKHYNEIYKKEFKNGYYLNGKIYLEDYKGYTVAEETKQSYKEKEPEKNFDLVNFYINHAGENFDVNKIIEYQILQNRLNSASEDDENYFQLKTEIEIQKLNIMSYDERKDYVTSKMWKAYQNKDLSAFADAIGEFYSYECEQIDNTLKIREAKDFIKDKTKLNALVEYIDKHIDNHTSELSTEELIWEVVKGVGDAIDSFIGAQGATMMAGLGIATGAATSAPAFLSKIAPNLISEKAASSLGLLISGAIQAYFGTEGSIMTGSGIIDMATANTKEQARGAGANIGLGTIMVHGAKKSARKTFEQLKLYEIKNKIREMTHYTDVDNIEEAIRKSELTLNEKKELVNECKEQTKKILKNMSKEIENFSESAEFDKKLKEVDKSLKELIETIDEEGIKNIARQELNRLKESGKPKISIYFEKKNIKDFVENYLALKSIINEIKNEDLKKELLKDLDGRINADSDMSLELRLKLAQNFYFYKIKEKTHSAALQDLLEYKYEENDNINIPIDIYKELALDIDKLDRVDELQKKLTETSDKKESNSIYEKYLQEETNANKKTIELCKKINNELGVKIILPGNLKEAGVALEIIYKELFNIKMHAEANGETAKFPAILNFLSANIKFFEDEYNKTDNIINNAFFDKSQNSIYIRGLSVESVKRLLRHELLHVNTEPAKEFPEGFDANKYIDVLIEAGLSDKEIASAIKNPGEFAIIAAEGNSEKYSANFKNLLAKLGLPKWALNINNTERQHVIITPEAKKSRLLHIQSFLDSNKIINKDSEIFYSGKAKQSPQAKLKSFIDLYDEIKNILNNKTQLSTEEKDKLLQDARTIINELTKYIEEKQENSVDYQICEDFRDAEIMELEELQEKLKYIDFINGTITGCKDLSLFKNPKMDIKTLLRLFKNSPVNIKVNSRHDKLNKYIEDYIKNYNISNKIHLTIERLEHTFYRNGMNSLTIENIIAEKKDGRFITIRDLFGLKDNQELSVNQIKFLKQSKDLQDLIDNEFEHVDILKFGEIKFNKTENCDTFELIMDSNTSFADTWKSVKYLFEHRLLEKGERMDAHARWELDYSTTNIKDNLKKEMNKPDWNGKALKTLYNSGNNYENLIINLISNSAIWTDNNGVTFFTSIHARTRFLERIILDGNTSNASKLTPSNIQKMIKSFGNSLNKDFVQNPEIFKHPSGHNPTVIINFNNHKYRVGLKEDGSCATIIKTVK